MMVRAPAWLTLREPTLARPNLGMRSRRSVFASYTGMCTLTPSRLTRDMVAQSLDLDVEREVAPHSAVDQIGHQIADHGHRKHDGISVRRRHFAEQGRTHKLEEIEQDVVIEDVSSV